MPFAKMSKYENLRAESLSLLESNILPFWATRMVDNERGGFYGRIDGHNILHPDAPKGAVLNARILWAFSAASRVLHSTPYRLLADRAYDYFMHHFIDRESGGVYWSIHADGTPLDTRKQTFAIAYAIYGLTEYVRLTNNQEALNAAIRLFNDLEAHAYKFENEKMSKCKNGYLEALTRDWQPISDMCLSEQDENAAFTMNTHLHVLEAYTNLYRVYKDPRVAQQLRVLIDIFVNRLFNPANGHLGLFFDDEWKPLTCNPSPVTRHLYSPGHDIEAAWLLHEALEVLGDPILLKETLPVCQQLAQAAEDGIFNESQWWCYAEAVVGYIDQWKLNQKDLPVEAAINLEMAEAAWDYIKSHLIDREHGEWYWAILPDGTPDTSNDKAGFWKCPYHNSRMCIEIIERL